MSYVKTDWIARDGVNLMKFTKQNETATTVELINTPDSVTVAGTPFTVESMNNIENALDGIYNQDVTISGDKEIAGNLIVSKNSDSKRIEFNSEGLWDSPQIELSINTTAGFLINAFNAGLSGNIMEFFYKEGETRESIFQVYSNFGEPYLNFDVPINVNAGINFGSTKTAGKFYTGTTEPTNTTRLNYDGNFHVTNIKSSALNSSAGTKTAGNFYTGTTNPTNTDRLNYDGNLHVTDIKSSALNSSGSTKTAGNFYTGTTNPDNTDRLNYDGSLVVTNIRSRECVVQSLSVVSRTSAGTTTADAIFVPPGGIDLIDFSYVPIFLPSPTGTTGTVTVKINSITVERNIGGTSSAERLVINYSFTTASSGNAVMTPRVKWFKLI